jgi:hypothetical protein
MTKNEIEKIEEIINNKSDYSKFNIKWLKSILEKYDPNITYNIFDQNDSCLCSFYNRKRYKENFISYWNNKKNEYK